jgi:hypothetical protein
MLLHLSQIHDGVEYFSEAFFETPDPIRTKLILIMSGIITKELPEDSAQRAVRDSDTAIRARLKKRRI